MTDTTIPATSNENGLGAFRWEDDPPSAPTARNAATGFPSGLDGMPAADDELKREIAAALAAVTEVMDEAYERGDLTPEKIEEAKRAHRARHPYDPKALPAPLAAPRPLCPDCRGTSLAARCGAIADDESGLCLECDGERTRISRAVAAHAAKVAGIDAALRGGAPVPVRGLARPWAVGTRPIAGGAPTTGRCCEGRRVKDWCKACRDDEELGMLWDEAVGGEIGGGR